MIKSVNVIKENRIEVVLKHAGKLRFKYTGPDSEFTSEKSFEPIGITTGTTKPDSNHRLWEPANNIVYQDRQFLYTIDNYDIRHPYRMFVDVRDNIHVTKFDEFNVKKKSNISYQLEQLLSK